MPGRGFSLGAPFVSQNVAELSYGATGGGSLLGLPTTMLVLSRGLVNETSTNCVQEGYCKLVGSLGAVNL